jgi:hypothetical protein
MAMRTTARWAATFLAGAAACAAGCVDNNAGDATLIILQNQVPDSSCQVQSSRSTTFRGRGVIDAEVAGPYVLTPLVESRAESLDSSDPFQRSISVEGADVSLTFADESLVNVDQLRDTGNLDFTQRFTAILEPGSLAALSLISLPQAVLDDLAGSLAPGDVTLVLADVTVFGRLGGGRIESNTFAYPMDVCIGCRQRDVGSCVGYEDSGELQCFPGQDDYFIDCCISSSGARVCPAVPEA